MGSVYKYQPWVVYQNIEKLLKYRHITSNYAFIRSVDQLNQKFISDEYIIISGQQKRPDNINGAQASKNISIVLIGPNSDYANNLAKFRRLFNAVYKDDLHLMLIISDAGVSTYIKKTLGDEFTMNRSDFTIRDYTYSLFTIAIPEHIQVPMHSFASQGEIVDMCRGQSHLLRRLLKIRDSDPAAVWIGAEPGDVVKIIRPSESAGTALIFRYCIRGD